MRRFSPHSMTGSSLSYGSAAARAPGKGAAGRCAGYTHSPCPPAGDFDRELPRRVNVPSGSSIEIDYSDETQPVLRVKLQEVFGARDMPPLAKGRRKAQDRAIILPAGRPAAITQDLGRFWSSGYAKVRSEMRGRYPKHSWPEDPDDRSADARAETAVKRGLELANEAALADRP